MEHYHSLDIGAVGPMHVLACRPGCVMGQTAALLARFAPAVRLAAAVRSRLGWLLPSYGLIAPAPPETLSSTMDPGPGSGSSSPEAPSAIVPIVIPLAEPLRGPGVVSVGVPDNDEDGSRSVEIEPAAPSSQWF